jgi:hypothetical protein
LYKRQAQFKALHAQVQELIAAPARSPTVELGSLAKLAAALEELHGQAIPAARRRHRKSLIGVVVQLGWIVFLPPEERTDPPIGACFLLDLLLAKTDRETIPGDLEEEFTTSILPKYGVRRARFWFWTQTVRTIARRNPISRLILVGGLTRLVEWIFRSIGG